MEEAARGAPGVGEAEAVAAQRLVGTRYPPRDLVGYGTHPVGYGHDRTLGALEFARHVRNALLLLRVQQVVLLRLDGVPAQLVPRGGRPHVRLDLPLLGEDALGLQGPGHGHAGGQDLRRNAVAAALLVPVEALEDALHVHALRLGGLADRLVVDGQVVEDVLGVLAVHAAQAVPHDVRDLEAERRVVGDAGRVRRGEQLRVAVRVLRALAGQRGAAGGRAQHEAARELVTHLPELVAGALEPEHRVEDVDRDERLAVRRVRRARGDQGGRAARLRDAVVQHLPGGRLLVGQEQVAVHRLVGLPQRVVDLRRGEQRVHAERAVLVRGDRHEALADLLVPHQVLQQPHERHRGGDLLLAGALADGRVRLIARKRERLGAVDAGGHVAAELAPPVVHVLDLFRVPARVVVRRQAGLQFAVRDRQVQPVAEAFQIGDGQLLHLVGRVAALEVRPEHPALDRLGEDHRGLALVLLGGLVRRVDLAVVVPAAAEVQDLVVGHALDHLAQPLVAAEEVLADVRTGLGGVGLELPVRRGVQLVDQHAVPVLGQQRVPGAVPDQLDHVPAGAAEDRLQLLDDLAVAAHGTVEALEVAVDDERQVVQALARRDGQLAERLGLVHLAVAEERPDVRPGGVRDAAGVHVAVHPRLVDGADRTEPHGDGRELPEVRHHPRVRIAGQTVRGLGALLAERVQVLVGEPVEEVGARVDARRGVSLEEHLVAAVAAVLAAEEVVEADVVQRRRGAEGGDVATHPDPGTLGAGDRHRRVPAGRVEDLALDLLVAGEERLVLGRDRVDVVRAAHLGHGHPLLTGALDQAEHEIAGPLPASLVDGGVERVEPLLSLLRVEIRDLAGKAANDDRVAI